MIARAVVLAAALTPAARADPSEQGPEQSPEAPTAKRRLSSIDLAEKREDGYYTGLPLLNVDPDTGVGFGGRVYHYWNGRREDPRFSYTPYLVRTYGQVFLTTRGYQYQTVDLDAPYVWGSPFRIRAALVFERNGSANYFGRGPSTLGPLTFPGSPSEFTRMDDYRTALKAVQPDGTTYARYDRYVLTRPAVRASIERDLFGGVVRVLGGVSVSYVLLSEDTGKDVAASGASGQTVQAPEAPTHLHDDCSARRVSGCVNGWNNQVRLGIAYDTRDFEPDPKSGAFVDLTAELSAKALGSAQDYGRVTLSPRIFVSLVPGSRSLVLAARFLYSAEFGDVPFYDMNGLALTDGDIAGLGGLRTIRGYNQDRFVGRVAALSSFELRWTFYDFTVAEERFHLILVPSMDLGRVFDRVQDATLRGWKRGQGGAFRIRWHQTIVTVDIGFSSEATALYVDFGHQF